MSALAIALYTRQHEAVWLYSKQDVGDERMKRAMNVKAGKSEPLQNREWDKWRESSHDAPQSTYQEGLLWTAWHQKWDRDIRKRAASHSRPSPVPCSRRILKIKKLFVLVKVIDHLVRDTTQWGLHVLWGALRAWQSDERKVICRQAPRWSSSCLTLYVAYDGLRV